MKKLSEYLEEKAVIKFPIENIAKMIAQKAFPKLKKVAVEGVIGTDDIDEIVSELMVKISDKISDTVSEKAAEIIEKNLQKQELTLR